MAVGSKIQPGRGRFKHGFIELKFGLDILFILENSWFNYIGDQRKSPKNETPYLTGLKIYGRPESLSHDFKL